MSDIPSEENEKKVTDGWDKPLFDSYLQMDHKLDYILKPKKFAKQSKDTCIICKIIKFDETVHRFEIYRDNQFIVYLNLYPYTPGHLMISPLKHVIEYNELNSDELLNLGKLTQKCIEMLKNFSRTESFNVGWNQGLVAGGSIKHFHVHIVPRYPNELNFIEIIAKTKPTVISLEDTEKFLQKYQLFLSGEKTIEEIFNNKT